MWLITNGMGVCQTLTRNIYSLPFFTAMPWVFLCNVNRHTEKPSRQSTKNFPKKPSLFIKDSRKYSEFLFFDLCQNCFKNVQAFLSLFSAEREWRHKTDGTFPTA